jgi:peptidoglycan-associated lipoprotein
MKSPYEGLRFAAVAAAFLLVAACSSNSETGNASTSASSTSPSSSTVTPGTQQDLVASVGDRVFFDFDKSILKDEGKATLQRQAAWMKLYPKLTFILEGHADERGTRDYNLALGGRRAAAAKDFLISLGIDTTRIKTVSYGKERPICLDSTEDCWSQNRRSVTVVAESAGS